MTVSKQQRSIDILSRCLNLEADDEKDVTRQHRLDELLCDFVTCKSSGLDHADGWHFCIPASFRAALDIKWTRRKVNGKQTMKWTQGSWFHFEEGDTIYDSPKAYGKWDLNDVQVCVDIRRASPAKPAGAANREARYAGTVIFDVLTPNDERTQLVKRQQMVMSQDEFIRMLIVGPPAGMGLKA